MEKNRLNITIYWKNWESAGLKRFNDSKPFICYSNGIDNIYKNIEE